MEGSRDFAEDRWARFDLTSDFSEAIDVAADHPDVVRRLEQQWLIEAGRNDGMPLSPGLDRRFLALISPHYPIGPCRSEERRVWTWCVSLVRSRWSPLHYTK